MNFSSLKKNRGAGLEKLNDQLTKMSQPAAGGKEADNRFWKPEVDKAGNGYAVVRFLPAPGEEDVPFVRLFDHAFKGPGGWLIDSCLTTVGEKCPVCEHNSELWNTGSKDLQAQVRQQKRKLSFISNIYVVKDPANPENEGKVFLYKFGKKIFDKLNAAMNPEFEDESPINPFDLWEGANFKIKIRKVEGYQNYDKSEFDASEALHDDDDVLEQIWKSEYPLQEFLKRENFKSYDDLKGRLTKTLGLAGSTAPNTRADMFEMEEAAAPAAPVRQAPQAKQDVPWDAVEDDDVSMFENLMDD